jgi:cell division septation protein DedD
VISNASAATVPLEEAVDSDYPADGDATQSAAEVPFQLREEMAESPEKRPSSYMVMIKMPETSAATEDLVDQLRSAGENDFLVYPQTGRISLGIFENLASAEKRRREIERLGFTTHTLERYR